MQSRICVSVIVFLLLPFLTILPASGQHETRHGAANSSIDYVLSQNDFTGFTLEIRFPAPQLQGSRLSPTEYFVPVVEGCYGATAPGKPNLPAWNRMIELPPGAGYTITVTGEIWHELAVPDIYRHMVVEPVQPSVSKSHIGDLPRHFDTAVYALNNWFGYGLATVADDGILRDARIARLGIHPVEYNPVTGALRYLSAATITLHFSPSDATFFGEWKASMASPFINTSSFTLNGPSLSTTQITAPAHYVILSDSMFQNTLQPFIGWKRRKGFQVTEVYKGSPGVGTTAASMKSYLEGLYQNATSANPAPSFLLIVGDVEQIPAFPQSSIPIKPTDMFYAEYTGDIYPDLLYGRFSATSTAQLQAQINKTLHAEQYLMSDPSYLQHMVLVAGVDGNFATLMGNGQIHYAFTTYVNANNNLTPHTWYYPSSAGQTIPILQRINQGVSLVNYTAHASSSGWQNPSFNNGHVGSLTNTGMYPLVISNACHTNTFSDPSCFGETLLRAAGKGAVGHIGGANETFWDEDYYFSVGYGPIVMHPSYLQSGPGFYDRLFHIHGEPYAEWAVTQGAIIHAGNLAVTQSGSSHVPYYWEVYHLMGDPSLMPWLGIPAPVAAGFPSVLPIGVNQVTIHSPPYSYVAITSGGMVHGAAVANSYGVATVHITPATQPLTAEVVITGQNLIPFFDTIDFITPSGPFVLADSVAFNDHAGNNNNLIEAGESIHVTLKLKNFTSFGSGSLTITLTSQDPYIQLTDSVVTIPGGISGLNSLMLMNAFAFDVAAFVPDQHLVQVTITVADSADSWPVIYHFVVNSPVLHISSIRLSDEPGNNNGMVEPGEPFAFVVTLKNKGHAPLQSLPVTLAHNSPYLQLDGSAKTLTTFDAGSTYTLLFTGTALNTPIPEGSFVKVTAVASFTGYIDTLTTFQMLVPVVEDFGTGLGDLPWSFSGSQHWHLVSDTPYTGQYCMRSGAIPDQSVTSMSITLPILSHDTISFMYRVSSEELGDYLIFSVNQVEMGRWSGEKLSWQRAAFSVDPGEVTFSWSYRKNHGTVDGYDRAWIDYIIFPVTSVLTGTMEVPEQNMSVQVYPNPSAGSVTVVLDQANPERGTLVLFSADGRMIYQRSFAPGEHTIVLNEGMNTPGLYILYIETPSAKVQKKIIRF